MGSSRLSESGEKSLITICLVMVSPTSMRKKIKSRVATTMVKRPVWIVTAQRQSDFRGASREMRYSILTTNNTVHHHIGSLEASLMFSLSKSK